MTNAQAVTRRSKYSDATIESICERLRRGEGIASIARDPAMPCRDTMMNWLDTNRFGFREHYLESKRIAAFLLAEQLMEVARDDSKDYFTDEHGTKRPNHAHVQRSKLICDAIKWQVGKMLPKVYGDKTSLEHEVTGDLAELLRNVSNRNTGLPPPIQEDIVVDADTHHVPGRLSHAD